MIIDVRHPEYDEENWTKYALAYSAGHDFVENYVKMFSNKEDATEFINRKAYSYTPAFAKEAINEVKNAIFQRISDVTRTGGSELFRKVFEGQFGGVDLKCSSMNAFIGRDLLPELLIKAKVGVFVDMPILYGDTKTVEKGNHPYLYHYKAEDILSWDVAYDAQGFYFTSVLLRDYVNVFDEDLPADTEERFRLLRLVDGMVTCVFYNDEGIQCDVNGVEGEVIYTINIPKIPFVVAELNQSLMADISDYQIALVNLASSDISYALRANFPFYVEQNDFRVNNNYMKQPEDTETGNSKQDIGTMNGRQYPIGAERPAFINPSSEPLEASMKKQDTLKQEIRQLVHLALTNVEPKMASAESKAQDQHGLEAGLSYIGLELETLERQIAQIWAMYEGSGNEATIKYPKRYSLKSDEEKIAEAKTTGELIHRVPSLTFKKEIIKRVAGILLGDKVSAEVFDKIIKEIEEAKVLDADPETIIKDVEAGLVDAKTASETRGYPKGCAELAKKEHAERLAEIAASQSKIQNRGVKDMQNKEDAKKDKVEQRGV